MHDVFVAFMVTLIIVIVIFQVPIGMTVDNARKGFITAVAFAIIDALSHPTLVALGLPDDLVPFEVFSFVINGLLMIVVGFFVPGFRLRWGVWTVVLCAVVLSLIETVIFYMLNLEPFYF